MSRQTLIQKTINTHQVLINWIGNQTPNGTGTRTAHSLINPVFAGKTHDCVGHPEALYKFQCSFCP